MAGVMKSRHLRGRWFKRSLTNAIWTALIIEKSEPLGKYWRIRPFVFSLVSRSQEA